MSFDFYIDTADISYIENLWEILLKKYVQPKHFLGCTTNPLSMSREGFTTLKEWETRTKELCRLVSKIKKEHGGSVHVQLPNDSLTYQEVINWAHMVSNWKIDKLTHIVLKLPPYKKYLETLSEISDILSTNITGTSSWSMSVNCTLYQQFPNYISQIPGRMQEVGINAQEHVKYLSNLMSQNKYTKIITGSMRTLEQLKYCVEYGTVPTIGKTVLNQLSEENCKEVFSWTAQENNEDNYGLYPPIIEPECFELSKNFFGEMNEVGKSVYEEFIK